MDQMELAQEILDLVISRMLFNRELVYLHRSLLVGLVSSDCAAHYLQRPTQLTNLSEYTVLFVLDQNVLVAGLRNMRVHIEFVVAYVGLKH